MLQSSLKKALRNKQWSQYLEYVEHVISYTMSDKWFNMSLYYNDIESIKQDVLIIIWKKSQAGKIDFTSNIFSYIMTAVSYFCMEIIRKSKRRDTIAHIISLDELENEN